MVTPAAAEGFFRQVWVFLALVFVVGFFWMVGSSSLYGCALLRQVGQGSRIPWTSHKMPWAQRGAHGFSLSRGEFSLVALAQREQPVQTIPQPYMATLSSEIISPDH